MMQKLRAWSLAIMLGSLLFVPSAVYAVRNQILGEIRFYGLTGAERTAGVWVDGRYLGYVDELKGSKKVVLLPGEHQFTFKQTGYQPFVRTFTVEPGEKQNYLIWMARDTGAQYPTNPAEVKIAVHPRRAAVFVDNHFVGHVGEFEGPGRAMLLSPGKHHFRIALPGYQSFDTEVNLLANQRFELKTNLFGGDITQTDPVLKQ
ncbi:MAG: PEGA domain-containing protein [Acidobacteriia bacterium]|nr:PEGA domain-containing protein [Terriglobia bacterium]